MGEILGQFTGFGGLQHFVYTETALGFFLRHMELKQHVDGAVDAGGLFLNEFEQADTVNALDDTHVGHDSAHFVLLQVADEVPTDIAGQLWSFGDKLLGAILAEEPLSGVIGLLQSLDWMEL